MAAAQTTLWFYRPGDPPALDGPALARFVRGFAALGLGGGEGPFVYRLKSGEAIDRDERLIDEPEPAPEPGRLRIAMPGTDEIEGRCESLDELAKAVEAFDRSLYRAELYLGPVVESIGDAVDPVLSAEGEEAAGVRAWTFEAGPIVSARVDSEEPFFVGWMALGIEADGLLEPEAFPGLIEELSELDAVRGLEALCRATWPVEPAAPPKSVMKVRQTMGELWPYEAVDTARDWYWGLLEVE